MDGRGGLWPIVGLGFLVAFVVGCSWLNAPDPWEPPPVFSGQPTLDQLIAVVNGNSGRIQTFSTERATLSGPGIPTLRASIVFQRPRRLRLRGETGLSGPELDVGSNDELFWIWIRRNEPPGVYYCRHDEFAGSAVRRRLPIDPDWLIQALGVTEFDPALPHQGPFPLPGGRLQVRTIIDTPEGPSTKVTVVDGRTGLVLEQHLYDARGQLVASAINHSHRRDPLTGIVMPRVVDIVCPPAGLSLRIDLGYPIINRPEPLPPMVFAMPSYAGAPPINLCQLPREDNLPPAAETTAWRNSTGRAYR